MTGNDFVKFFLRTPFYFFLGNTMLITVTGCRTGKKYSTPVGYYREDDCLWVLTSRDRTWWRNVRSGADVSLLLHGKEVHGFAEAELDEQVVQTRMGEYLVHEPRAARPLGIRTKDDRAEVGDIARAAKDRLFVRIRV